MRVLVSWEGGVTRPPVRTYKPLRCYSNVMEGRGYGLKRLNLGHSIDHSCKGFQHFWVSSGVVSFCIGFALPQADRNHIQAARICQCDFVLEALLLAKHWKNVVLKGSGIVRKHVGFQAERHVACKHMNLLIRLLSLR